MKIKKSKDVVQKVVKNSKKGFTLIELLVVIVIIGILVAFALPRYYTSAKIAEVKSTILLAKQLLQAEDRYYMIHDTYTKNMEDLDIYVPYERKVENTATQNSYYGIGKYNTFCHLYNTAKFVDCVISSGITLDCSSSCNCYQAYGKDNICSKLGVFSHIGSSNGYKYYKVIF